MPNVKSENYTFIKINETHSYWYIIILKVFLTSKDGQTFTDDLEEFVQDIDLQVEN